MTPWGEPSDALIIGEFEGGIKVAFLPRHGRGHYLTPTEVPSKANIAALKHVGCKVILVRLLLHPCPDHYAISVTLNDQCK